MAKIRSKKDKKLEPVAAQKQPAELILPENRQSYLFIAIMVIILVYLLKPMVIDGLSPQGVDVVGSIGETHKISQWSAESGEKALWNPYIFSGMPGYQRSSPVVFSVDTVLHWFGRYFNNVFIFYLFGGTGLFLFLRYLGMSPFVAWFGAIIFVLMPHYKSLFLEGHYTKFRALMVIPWMCLSFKYFLDKRSLLSAALFALFFGVQIRTQHYQIVFYSGLLIFAIGFYPVLKDLLDKSYLKFTKSITLIIAAVTLAILTASQPLFLANEYLPWSKRGKTTIDISAPEKTKDIPAADGVSMEYATQWSTAPDELITWAVPRYFGGMSREKYSGDAIAQLKGREIPGYWGEMPFTQSYEYMGAITLLLAAIGLFYNRTNKFVISLAVFAAFLTLLSFGRHAEWFYSVFYNYIPYFNKFRAPMMSVTVTFFIVAVLAAFGLSALKDKVEKTLDFRKNKNLFLILGSFISFGILLWAGGQALSFIKAGEAYDAQTTAVLQTIRMEMLNSDMLRYMALIAAASIAIIMYLSGKLKFIAVLLLLSTLSLIDLINIQSKVEKPYNDITKIENSYFRELESDRVIQQDKGLFRVYPMEGNFGNNRFSYFHQSIGGYSPIKMYHMEELVTNNLYNGTNPNRNVMKILNVKYLISSRVQNAADLIPVNIDENQQLYTYRYNGFKERGFFIGSVNILEDEYRRLEEINNPAFNPDSTAILEEPLLSDINFPDSSSVKVTLFNPNQTHFDVYTDKQSLFVISEIYYPPGWKILINGNPAEKIYKANHAVQAVVVPAGRHKIEVNFAPDSYQRNVQLALGSVSLIFLIILGSLIKHFLEVRRVKAV